jgi:DNA-binding HxlR family transcriptional regulator
MDSRVEKVELTMALIGSRWCPAIMFALITQGTQRFSGLRRLIPQVSQRMLTKQLRELERAGVVRRQFFESVPPRVEYSATELGMSLQAVYVQVCTWSEQNWPAVELAKTRYDSANATE